MMTNLVKRDAALGAALAVVTLAAMWPTPVFADELAYVRASSQFDSQVNRNRFTPQNLLDRNPNTLWCEGKANGDVGESVEFVFKTDQIVDRVVLMPAAQSGRVVESWRLTDGNGVVKLQVGATISDAHLVTPLHGTHFTLSIDHVGQPQSGSVFSGDVACLADIVLYHGDQPLTASHESLPADNLASHLAGSWGSQPLGAPENTLVFALDGTWIWRHEPLMGGPAKEYHGTYKVHGNQLLMRKGQNGRFIDMELQTRQVIVDKDDLGAPQGNYDEITLGAGLGKELAGAYNNAQF